MGICGQTQKRQCPVLSLLLRWKPQGIAQVFAQRRARELLELAFVLDARGLIGLLFHGVSPFEMGLRGLVGGAAAQPEAAKEQGAEAD